MAIIVFADVILPNSIISAGVRGKNMRLNSRVPTDGGYESINIVWTQTLRQFEVGIVPLRVDQWQTIETLHEITEGGAYGLLMEDPKDNFVTTGGIITEVRAGVYQLIKRYTEPSSGRTKDRRITRPKGAVSVFQDGLPIPTIIDPLTGHVSFEMTPDLTKVTWTGSFYVPVHFMDDVIDWELVAPGSHDSRFAAGPSVVLQEVRE